MRTGSLKDNFVMNVLLTMSTFLFPLITFPYVSRILLPDGMGRVSFAASVLSYFSALARLGIPTYGVRACARVRDDREALTRVTHELLAIGLFMTVFVYAAFFLTLKYVPRMQKDKTLFAAMSVTILLDSVGAEWLYKALEQYRYMMLRSVILKLVALIAVFALVRTKEDVLCYGVWSIFAASASNLLNLIRMRKYVDWKPIGNYHILRHMKEVGVFFAMTCATTVYIHLDTVMLGFIAAETEVGFYHAATKLRHILLGIVTSLGAVLLPRVSYYIEKNRRGAVRRMTEKALSFVFVSATPLVVYFILFAKEGIIFLSGAAYIDAVAPMRIVMPTVLLVGISNVTGMQILIPLGKEKTVLCSELVGAAVDLLLNALLIPHYASVGAAVGTLLAECAVLLVQCFALRDAVKSGWKRIHYLKIAAACVLGAAVSLWVKVLGLGSFLTLAISAVLFFCAYGLFLLWSKEELLVELWDTLSGKLRKRGKNDRLKE